MKDLVKARWRDSSPKDLGWALAFGGAVRPNPSHASGSNAWLEDLSGLPSGEAYLD
jgi:hypothetical protein